ncbi:S-adenosyl-L-methionine-dependent methyltransferase [Cladochytrium replicatum]|nr:S-adenosyl-L-methionine-dependent methyltransferase [Cladochytrium replicatum]
MGAVCSSAREPRQHDHLISTDSEKHNKIKVDVYKAAAWTTTNNPAVADTRTYHSVTTSPYMLPGDVTEGSRLNLQHHLIRQLFDGPNFMYIPQYVLEKGATVLDVGCGTGIWLAEMNRDFPHGRYFGVDINISSFAQTFKEISGDDKITLQYGNILDRLPFEDGTFDYVHMQYLTAAIPEKLWPHVINEITRVLKPGGYVDLVEPDGVCQYLKNPTKIINDFDEILINATSARGINIRIASDISQFVQNSNQFEAIQTTRRTAPIGFDGMTGQLWKIDIKRAMMAAAGFAAASMGVATDQWEVFVDNVMNDYGDCNAFYNLFRICAKKRTAA